MAILSNGLETLEVGATAWRLIINSNLSKIYSKTEADGVFLKKTGGTLTGFLTLHADPTSNLHAVTKQYVDNGLSGVTTASDTATFTNKTLDDMTNKIGADHVHFKVYNNTGSTLTRGTVVTFLGYDSGEDAIRVTPVTTLTDVAIGIVEADISTAAYGLVINTGVIDNIDTSGYPINTILYQDGAGSLTDTQPVADYYQACAVVVRQQSVNGALMVEFTEPKRAHWDDRYYTESEIDTIMGSAGLLPSQAGKDGYYLRTNGTTAYWDPISFDASNYMAATEIPTAEDNAIDFSTATVFELTATAADITASNLVAGQSGIILVHSGENITGWGSEFKFKNVPTDLSGDELFSYYIDNSSSIWIGRLQ